MGKTKRILIVYTNYGTGHLMAAKACREHVLREHPDYKVDILDPLSYSRPIINRIFAKIGRIGSTKLRNFRGNIYKQKMFSEYTKNSYFFSFCIKLFWTKKLATKLRKINPEIIISTQVGPTGLLAAHREELNAKLISVFTDYGIHRMYVLPHEYVDEFWVPTKAIAEGLIKLGVAREKIKSTGIPVRCTKNEKHDIRNEHKLPSEMPLVLFVCGGGNGYGNALKYFEKLLDSRRDFSFIFIAGRNKALRKKALKIAKRSRKPGIVLGYVRNVYDYISAADLLVGKPGGILTSESLNLETPFMAVAPIPGQEINNSSFLEKNRFGLYARDMADFESKINKILSDEKSIKEMRLNIQRKFKKYKQPSL